MSLAVDARWMVGQFRGMGRYAHFLMKPVKADLRALLPQGYPSSDYETVYGGNGFFPYWEQVELPRLCSDLAITDLICPYNTAPIKLLSLTRLTLVVHDLIYMEPWHRLPPSVSIYQTLGRVYRRLVVPQVIARADRLVTVSEYTRGQINRRFSIPRDNISVIPNSLPDDWFVHTPLPNDERIPYLLAVAGEAPSKNLPALIRAFSAFRSACPANRPQPSLRVVGIKAALHPHFQRIATRCGVGGWVHFESFLDEATLRRLYREATLFVMPSLYEGFGIPVLEAMASGTPVVCSNTTSLPEVVGDSGWLFDPRSTSDMAAVLSAAWSDDKGRRENAQRGQDQALKYKQSEIGSQINSFWA
jgi:glycosyltransferase involved in cell wall biosynthesis